MSAGVAAGLAPMKTVVFSQSGSSHIPNHAHTSTAASATAGTATALQQSTFFSQQMQQQQQQHMLQQQQQQQQRVQQQHAQVLQAAHLHRLSQPHIPSSLAHPTQSVTQSAAVVNNNNNNTSQSSVFTHAEFFQTLQQTAAALPTVLPYDQPQYFGQLMYFPYPTAATATVANGLFGTTPATDSHHMTVGSTAQGTSQTAILNQPASNANQLIGNASLVSATPGGMVTLNQSGVANQVQPTGHLVTPSGTNLVGLGTVANGASASLAPLFTTAHFYPHHHQQQQQQQQQHHHSHQQTTGNQSALSLQHPLQLHSQGSSLQMQHIQPLTGHGVAMHTGQTQLSSSNSIVATIPPGSVQSAASQVSNFQNTFIP